MRVYTFHTHHAEVVGSVYVCVAHPAAMVIIMHRAESTALA